MVGLSVILEPNQGDFGHKNSPQVVSKASVVVVNRTGPHYSFVQTPPFPNLHSCYLCNQILLPSKDIYMYKGDKGFCSVECRCRQILMDEEENEEHLPIKTSPFSTSSRKSTRNSGRGGDFAYS